MSAFILTTCPGCKRGFTPELWTALRLLGHQKSEGRLLEFRACACGFPNELPVCDGLIYAGRLDLLATDELPALAELVGRVVLSAPADKLDTPIVNYARLIERQLRAELERRLGEEARRGAR